ncbi:MAG TPA: hypothetical protein PKX48_14100 [Planctomycetota bacterium]|jgi:hypothetical protein|nr:hypothetical protein [Planctomycetota bacterium]OQC19537.1 MAG: hypothetical protein BWX69_02646 [Planctomycetes bacterium ADurb.Bin069]HNR99906.1 hypothetical protein [Planctomycetota bacterium]HNU26422.1 hypothetical protein [Planctomycetota bacterium]HOE31227.1 hypothetical protein [Planctomycetota bacterium]
MRARTCAPAALAVLLCGCFGTSWRQSAGVLKDMNTEVELERMFEAGTPKDAGFAHPADIPTEHLAAFVSRLAYEQPKLFGSTEYLPLVAEPHVAGLSAAIAEGLARAGPAERVRFAVVNTRFQLGFLPKPRTTRGVAFLKPQGMLNLAFDLIDENTETDMPGEHYLDGWGDPTRHAITRVTLCLPAHAALFRDDDGTEHPLWVVAPVEALAAAAPPETTLAPPTAAPAASVPSAAGPAPRPAAADRLTGEEAMQLLKNLDELKRRGVLSEEEYRAKVEAVHRRYDGAAAVPPR